MATNRTVYHVVPNAAGETWLVTQEGGDYREAYATKEQAVASAKERA